MYSNFAPWQSGFAVRQLAANRKARIAINWGTGQLAQSWLSLCAMTKNAFDPARSLLAFGALVHRFRLARLAGKNSPPVAWGRPAAIFKGIGIF
jgi:hypothetical protein